MKITVVGSANMDMVIKSKRQPRLGETLHGDGFFLSPGGKGANQAVACAKMGSKTWLLGRVGRDIFGNSLKESLNNNGVYTEFLESLETTTGVAVITVIEGNNTIILDAGSNAKVLPEIICKYENHLLNSDAILLQMEIPMETNYKIIEICKGKTPIFLNPAPATDIDISILNGIDYFTPNETEAPFYTNIEINTIKDAFSSIDFLRNLGVKFPVITLGSNGVAYFNGKENKHLESFKVNVIDTTAAGDTFSGALAFMIASGKPIDDAVYFAQAAAAISVTKAGAQSSIPYFEEVNNFVEGYAWG